ncbi:MAG: hypothetical protein JWQ81_4698 [Amycolatopsis sp.]|jgi:hypothetical protein|nr:hypothetical protein [Amycolatopsis sp.]
MSIALSEREEIEQRMIVRLALRTITPVIGARAA